MHLLLLPVAGILVATLAKPGGRRFLTGDPLDGRLRTNATFFRPPTKALHPKAHASPWHWRPGWHRAAARVGGLTLTVLLGYGLAWHRAATLTALALAAAAAVAWAGWRLYRGARSWARGCTWDRDHPWASIGNAAILPAQHYLRYRWPLTYALTADLGAPPAKVTVALDRSTATIWMPLEFTGADKSKEAVTRAVAAKLALEAPEPSWKLHGRRPRVTYTLTQPPPSHLTWDDMAAEIGSAKPHELVVGVGQRGKLVKVSLTLDSPHFGIISGTGGGKSNLAAFWLVQALRRGDIALILDAKRFSHPWAFKDMDAEYDQLPNVAYCRTVSDLHDAMCWLGEELDRRNEITEQTITAKGDVRGDVGPRMWIIAEEMNLAYAPLKQYWAAIRDPERDPVKSPAFAGLGAVSFAGRAAKMHLKPIGQMLRADILGGGDVRENIGVRMLTRYTQNSWKMQAGDIPMPPPSRVPGRWQCLASGEVSEAQVPEMNLEQVRDLATGGVVTWCPPGMPGRPAVATVRPRLALPPGPSDLHVVRGTTVEEVAVGLTIAEAVADGIYGPLNVEAARRRVNRAGLEPTGKRGDGSFTYTRADHFTAARDRRRKDAA